MYKISIKSNNPEDTLKIGKNLAPLLSKGDIAILTGELGSGKTKFVEGFLQNYNLQDEISSPTFNIVNEYVSSENNIYHFDVYRLADSDEFYAIGGEEYFEKGIIIELPNPEQRLKIMADHIELVCKYKGEKMGMLQSRKQISWYLKGFRGAAAFRNEAGRVCTLDDMYALIDRVLNTI